MRSGFLRHETWKSGFSSLDVRNIYLVLEKIQLWFAISLGLTFKMDHGVGSTDHFSALKIWMFENKFVDTMGSGTV